MENTCRLVDFTEIPISNQIKAKGRIFEELCIEYKQMGLPLEEKIVDSIVMSKIDNKLFYTQDGYFYYMFDKYKDKI